MRALPTSTPGEAFVLDKTVFNEPDDFNSPARAIVIAIINQTILDARAIAQGNARYFHQDGDRWAENRYNSAYTFSIMEEETNNLLEWLDSAKFHWWLECVGLDPNLVATIIKEIAAGHRLHDIRKFKLAMNASRMSTKHRASKKRK